MPNAATTVLFVVCVVVCLLWSLFGKSTMTLAAYGAQKRTIDTFTPKTHLQS